MEIATYSVLDDGSCIPVKIDLQTFQEKYSDRVIIFIIEELKRVFIWIGRNASVRQKFISSRVAQQLRMELGLGLTFKVKNVEQGMESREFIDALKNATSSKANVPAPVDIVVPTDSTTPSHVSSPTPQKTPSSQVIPQSSTRKPTPHARSSKTSTETSSVQIKSTESKDELRQFSPENLPTVSGVLSDNKSYINAWYPGPIILRKAVKLLSTKELGGAIVVHQVSATSFPINQKDDISWWLALFVENDVGNIKDCRESAPAAIIPFNPNHAAVSLPIPIHVSDKKAIYVSFTNPTFLSLQFTITNK